MEETLSNDRFISLHRNQINPQAMPMSTLTFAYGNLRYGKPTPLPTNFPLQRCSTKVLRVTTMSFAPKC